MKKVAYCLYLIIAISIAIVTPTRVWAETRTVTDVINEITFAIPESPTAEDWEYLVERFKDHHEDRGISLDQIAWFVQELERHRQENRLSDMLLGIGIKEDDRKVENAIDLIVKAFEAKTGAGLNLKVEENENGSFYFEVRTKEIILGKPAIVLQYGNENKYYASAWGCGSGRSGKIGNKYVCEKDEVIPIKVAYLNNKNEVVEVVDEPGTIVASHEKRMILVQKGETILGWFYPVNILSK